MESATALNVTSQEISSPKSFFLPPYTQVFENKSGFLPDLSIIDLLFNLGPEAGEYLKGSFFTTDFPDRTD